LCFDPLNRANHFVSPFNLTPFPSTCNTAPFSFQIPFNFYIDTYDPCGNGFRALAYFAELKGCGTTLDNIGADNCHAAWNELRLWIDKNHDGVSQPTELHTLDSMGVNKISLQYQESRREDQYGNAFYYVADIRDIAEPKANRCYDVFLLQGPALPN
jgi:hypothetical protein